MSEASRERTVAFVLYPGFTVLDMVGPLQVFRDLTTFDPRYRPVVVAETMEAVETDTPLRLTPSHTFDEVPDPDIVIVPGGGEPTIRAMGDERIRDYLLSAAETAEVVGSVCTGALILAAAGLLEGRKATTHWAYHRLLERLGATYEPRRWVEDGSFITAAGVSSGIDMALFLVQRLTNESTARMVQLGIEYDPDPPLGRIDWSTVDRDVLTPMLEQIVPRALADRPDLVAKLQP